MGSRDEQAGSGVSQTRNSRPAEWRSLRMDDVPCVCLPLESMLLAVNPA